MNRKVLKAVVGTLAFLAMISPRIVYAQLADESGTARLARIYEDAGKYEDAIRYYTSLRQQSPGNRSYFDGMLRCFVNLQRYDTAVVLIDEQLRQTPNDPSLLVQRGSVNYRLEKEEDAFADWEAAVEKQTGNPSIYGAIADEMTNLRLYDKAIEFLQRGENASKQPHVFSFKLARVYGMNNKFREAMREYIRYLVDVPSSLWQIQQYIAQYANLPDALRAALEEARAVAAENEENTQVQYLYSWLCMEAKDYESALEVYTRIDKLRKSGGRELLAFGQRAFNEGAYETAARTFQKIWDEYPKADFVPEARFYHARSMEESFNPKNPQVEDPTASFMEYLQSQPNTEAIPAYQGAVKEYEEIRRDYPEQSVGFEAAYRIGYIKYNRFHDKDGALAILTQVADQYRRTIGRTSVDMLIGDILIASGDLEKAMGKYAFITGWQQTEPEAKKEAQFRIAEALYFSGNLDSAITVLEPLTENTIQDIANDALDLKLFIQMNKAAGDAPLQQFARGRFLERQGKYSEAAAMMREIAAAFPTSTIVDHAWFAAAIDQRKSGDTKGAIEALDSFLTTFDDSILRDKVLFSLGDMYEYDIKNQGEAISAYTRLLAEYPNSIYVTAARERILALRKGNS